MAAPLILAHRGDATRVRENTFEAFEDALEAGIDGIELDVRAGPEGLLVHHDSTIRVRGRRRALGSITPSSVPNWVPTLDAVVHWGRGRKILIDVEIKEPGTETQVLQVCRPIRDKCVFTSFHPDVVHHLRESDPRLRVGWISKSIPDAIVAVASELRPPLVVIPARRCTAELVASLQDLGSRVWAWNVNTARSAERLDALGLQAFITDEPRRLAAWRDGRARPGTGPRMGRPEN